MAVSILQEVETSSASNVSSIISQAITTTAGSALHVFCCANGINVPTCSDTLNGTYQLLDSVLQGINRVAHFVISNVVAGSTTVTVSFGANYGNRGILVREVGGTDGYDGSHNAALQVIPGTGADVISSGNIVPNEAPGLISALCCDLFSSTTVTAGTGFTTGLSPAWANAYEAVSEHLRYTVTTPLAGTFTDATNGGTRTFATLSAGFTETAADVQMLTQRQPAYVDQQTFLRRSTKIAVQFLFLSAPIPSGTTILPPTGNLSLTAYAPTVQNSSDAMLVRPPTQYVETQTQVVPSRWIERSWLLRAQAAPDTRISVPAGSLILTGYAPSISVGQLWLVLPSDDGWWPEEVIQVKANPNYSFGLLAETASSFSFTAFIPPLSLSLTGFVPDSQTTGNGVTANVPLAALTLAAFAPVTTQGNTTVVNVPVGQLVLQGFAPALINYNFVYSVPLATLNLTLYPLQVSAGFVVVPNFVGMRVSYAESVARPLPLILAESIDPYYFLPDDGLIIWQGTIEGVVVPSGSVVMVRVAVHFPGSDIDQYSVPSANPDWGTY